MINREYRGRGLAKLLMKHALNFGNKNGCNFAYVETMSFQALEFYQKLGFKIEHKRDGYAAGISMYFLRRDL